MPPALIAAIVEKDESQSDSDNLPAPDVIAAEIIEDLQAALDQLKELEADLLAAATRLHEVAG
jgi:type I restriction enzyme M protein